MGVPAKAASGKAASVRGAREISEPAAGRPIRYSVCTMVTNLAEYAEMHKSFQSGGFDDDDCEFLYIDNSSGNRYDAFSGYNLFLQEARGTYIILCHQDVELLSDGRAHLDGLLTELHGKDPNWGVCGNAGATGTGALAIRITDPNTADASIGRPFPIRVMSLDENFIVVRRHANLALSQDIGGFHLYGADLCIIAETLGWSAYVIDFHLYHKSGGTLDASFELARRRMQKKHSRLLRPRWQYVTTLRPFYLSPSPAGVLMARVRRALARYLRG